MELLEKAWNWREAMNFFQDSQALRVFHGPGEALGELPSCEDFRHFALDRFGDHYWITQWENREILSRDSVDRVYSTVIQFLEKKRALSVVALRRPEKGIAPEAHCIFGASPPDRFQVMEHGNRFWIQFEKMRHPGLFLDHLPLRLWLKKNSLGKSVLNTFAYTGSLSVAAGLGGAKSVTTLDLSNATLQWAKANWLLNDLPETKGRFIGGDVFEWLPRLKRQKAVFDWIIVDPPSFSHGKLGKFSTSKDLQKLHELALDLLGLDGLLVTSINSSNISWDRYESEIVAAAKAKKMKLVRLAQLELPETFPTSFDRPGDRYLKGWILRRVS